MAGEKGRTHANRVCGYLKPKALTVFSGFLIVEEVHQSDGINIAINDFISRLPNDKRMKYIEAATKGKNSY